MDCWLYVAQLNQRFHRKRAIAFVVTGCLLTVMAMASCNGASPIPTPTVAPTPGKTYTPDAPATCHVISGIILGGGDTSPADLLDAPREFSYSVQTDAGQSATITYTAYPPSPNPVVKKIKLTFHAGGILIGDYVKACGKFNDSLEMLVVAEDGDYIETFASKP
jgi:hypothetical protein